MKKSSSSQDMWSMLAQLETTLDEYFGKKAPQLPRGVKDFIVMVAPYATILGVVLAVPAALALLGISAMFAPLTVLSGGWGIVALVSMIALIITLVLDVIAIPGLFKKQKSAWDKLFWVSLVNIVTALVGGHWVNLILGTAISWYFLFQVRSYYK